MNGYPLLPDDPMMPGVGTGQVPMGTSGTIQVHEEGKS